MDIVQKTKQLYKQFGQSKSMLCIEEPCYFLQRSFKGDQDMLIIFKTPSCRSHCKFCNLSKRDSSRDIGIIDQFAYAVEQLKHSLSVLDRFTLSNNGSILNPNTVPFSELSMIIQAITQVRNVSSIVLETELKYINDSLLDRLRIVAGKTRLNILTGFETLDESILKNSLGKYRLLRSFERQLDLLSRNNCDITAYILYKPSQIMSDQQAYEEAERSAIYLIEQCEKRKLQLTIRLNPMFAARGTVWAELAKQIPEYSPPRIGDVFQLAKKLNETVPTYLGLSTESKNEEWGSYRVHSDFTHDLMLDIIRFNSGRI